MADLRDRLQSGLADRYRIERELGRGGMATVFLAHDLRHDRPVALKVLHQELATTLGPERFQREIKLAARLQHPHILTVLDSGETAGQFWFTMPLVEGESLRERLRREQQLPVEDAVRITREAAQALQYAHDHGVIHRDIKPENLLLTTDGNTLVADFGIARALSAVDDRLTETGMSVGTPAYMSPEQASGERLLDARTDVYSMATVLYEMLAGEPPFTGPTAQAVIARRLSGTVPRLRDARPSVPEALEQATIRALAPVPADRFASAAEFGRALAASFSATSSAAQAADPGSTTKHASRQAGLRKQPVPLLATALVLGFLLGLGVLFAWRRSQRGTDAGVGSRVVAVIPFENVGDSAEGYFADGVSDEVRTRLAQIGSIQVIARGSSNEYRATRKTARQIARELGADYLLTGTVRWDKADRGNSRVRVGTELVDVGSGHAPRTKWGHQFDAALTDVFQVQADIAGQVAAALDIALGDSTRRQLATRPTENLEAYDAYLRGRQLRTGDIQTAVLHAAESQFRRAVELDPSFAAAWAELARTHVLLYRLGGTQPRDAEAARREVERATALAPDLPDVRAAKGVYQSVVLGDAAGALREYEAGLRTAPNWSDLLLLTSAAERRVGRNDAALSHLERAARLDPRSVPVLMALHAASLEIGRYDEAQAALDRALALEPSSVSLRYTQALLSVARGDSAEARRALRRAHEVADSTVVVAYVALREDLLWLLDQPQRRLVLSLTPADLDGGRADWALALAQTHWRNGQEKKARSYADTARIEYSVLIRDTKGGADRAQLLGLQALALGHMGRKDDAIGKGVEALRLVELSTAPRWQPAYIRYLVARTHLLVGDPEGAIDQLDQLVRTNYRITAGWLRINPDFAPLRGNPRFGQMVKEQR
jgi:eukaryotic-like serine/threonine-protein kinase